MGIYFDLAMSIYNETIMTDYVGEIEAKFRPLQIYMDRKLAFLYYSPQRIEGAISKVNLPEGFYYKGDDEVLMLHINGQISNQPDISIAGLRDHIARMIEHIIMALVLNEQYHISNGVLSMKIAEDATQNRVYHFYSYKEENGEETLKWRMFEYSPDPRTSDEYKTMLKIKNEEVEAYNELFKKEVEAYNELLDQHIALQEKYDKLTTIETHRANISERKL